MMPPSSTQCIRSPDTARDAPAAALVEEAASLQRTSEDTAGLARWLLLRRAARHDYERAMALPEEALALGQRAEDDYTTILSRALGAFAALGLGDHRRARELCKEGIRLTKKVLLLIA